MLAKRSLLFILCALGGCMDTHDASLGEQESAEGADAAPDAAAPEAGLPPFDAGAGARDAAADAAHEEPDAEQEEEDARDAATSLLCRLEPWHCL